MSANESEWELAEENKGAKAVTDFFSAEGLKEEDLKAYFEMKAEVEMLQGLLEEKRNYILEKTKGMESAMAGEYAAFFQKVSGRVTTDWKTAYRDAVGEMPSADVSKYVKKGEDTIRMEVKKIR